MRFYKKSLIFSFLVSCFLHTSARAAGIDISSRPEQVELYEPFILKIDLPYLSRTPGDPQEVRLEAKILTPDKKTVTAAGFCYRNKKREKSSLWEVRFTPVKEGKYEYYLELDSASLKKTTGQYHFDVVKSDSDGFLRRSKKNQYYLVFDSGKPFFGIGHNVGWAPGDSIPIFDRYFSLLEKNGCNLTRVWLSDWSFPIEWKKAGRYDQRASSSLDELLERAKKRGIYIMLSLDTYGSLMTKPGPWDEQRWEVNPYNAANGGPCEKAEDFFTDPEAKRLYKNRIRYIISRWGCSPNIMAFELWNEYNAPKEWVEEMSAFIKEIDPHGHLVTTSMWYPWGQIFDESEIWKLKDIDIVAFHLYGSKVMSDVVAGGIQKGHEFAAEYDKPFIMAETGMDGGTDDKLYDPKGWGAALHNGLWSTALSKYMASSMSWWWDTYIRPKKLYYHYRALSDFLRGVNWDSEKIEYARTGLVRFSRPEGAALEYEAEAFKPADKWGKVVTGEFTVLNSGDLTGGVPRKYLHGKRSEKFKKGQTYHVDYPVAGKFIMLVGMVSQQGNLIVYLDGKKVLEKEFITGPGEGPWIRSLYRRDEKAYQCVYNEDVVVDVPPGKHTIRLANTGKDWIGIKKITLTNYRSDDIADARCLGLVVGEDMLFWVQNRQFNWKNLYNDIKAKPIENASFDVFDVDKGVYDVMWWDTFRGRVISREKVRSKGGSLRLDIPEFSADIACKVRKRS